MSKEPVNKKPKPICEATIELDFPVEHKGETISSLKMQVLTAGETIEIQKQSKGKVNAELEAILFAAMCGVEIDLINSLSMIDFIKLQEANAGFFPLAGKRLEALLSAFQGT